MAEPFNPNDFVPGLTERASDPLYPKSHRKLFSVEGVALSGDGTQATVDFKWSWEGGPMEDTENLFWGHALLPVEQQHGGGVSWSPARL